MAEILHLNPYYDGVMMFIFPAAIPPKQTTGKTKNRIFESYLKSHLSQINTAGSWPITDKLMLCISVTGNEGWVQNCDVDNITKAILDCFKGIVYVDDKQIYSLIIEKRLDIRNGMIIGVRKIKDHNDYFGSNLPPYFLEAEAKTEKLMWHFIFDDSKNPSKGFLKS